VELMAFGIGAVIGSGIFILTGTAAAESNWATRPFARARLDLILHGTKTLFHYGPACCWTGHLCSFS